MLKVDDSLHASTFINGWAHQVEKQQTKLY